MAIKLSREEQETIITWCEADNSCEIYTCSPSLITKLDGYCKLYPDVYKLKRKDELSKTYSLTKNFITIRSGIKRTMSEENKKASAERLKNNRKK